jgi:CBS domain-containing membrane protein
MFSPFSSQPSSRTLTLDRPFYRLASRARSTSRVTLMTLAAALGIALVLLATEAAVGSSGVPAIVASMGASAVILYALPDTPSARLWPLFGGHLLSATVGILAARVIPHPSLALAVAIFGALLLMNGLRCVHPPGGATALTAVLGGAEMRELGFGFLVAPLLPNLIILSTTTWLLRRVIERTPTLSGAQTHRTT